MDVLSEVLMVKLRGAVFYNVEFSAPWSLYSPASTAVAPYCYQGQVTTSEGGRMRTRLRLTPGSLRRGGPGWARPVPSPWGEG